MVTVRTLIDVHKKQCIPVITRNEKHLSKQLVTIAHTLEKELFTPATFEGF